MKNYKKLIIVNPSEYFQAMLWEQTPTVLELSTFTHHCHLNQGKEVLENYLGHIFLSMSATVEICKILIYVSMDWESSFYCIHCSFCNCGNMQDFNLREYGSGIILLLHSLLF